MTTLPPEITQPGILGDDQSTIDPRLRARRISVRRHEGRRRLRKLVAVAFVVGVVGVGWLATRTPLLDVDHFDVQGNARVSGGEVLAAAGVELGDPMIDVQPESLTAALENLPWVADADVARQWPGTIQVRITERRPVAVVHQGEGLALVDGEGRLLGLAHPGDVGAPLVTGVDVVADAPAESFLPGDLRAALAAAELLPDALRPRIDSIGTGDDGLELRLSGGGAVVLGDQAELSEKLLAASTVIGELEIQGRGLDRSVLDVRVPTAPVLRNLPPPVRAG